MAFSAVITFRETRVKGKKVLDVMIPRRAFTFLRAAMPDSVSLVFEGHETAGIRLDAKEFARLVEKSKEGSSSDTSDSD